MANAVSRRSVEGSPVSTSTTDRHVVPAVASSIVNPLPSRTLRAKQGVPVFLLHPESSMVAKLHSSSLQAQGLPQLFADTRRAIRGDTLSASRIARSDTLLTRLCRRSFG